MKKTLAIIGLALVAGVTTVRADNTYTNVIVYQATNTASFWGGLGEAGTALLNNFKGDTNAVGATNWVVIPFASYDISTKKIGGGVAVVYPVNSLLYVGGRLEYINGTWTTPSLQVQIKTTIGVFGLKVTPFGVGGTAIIDGDVAAYTGAGAMINLFTTTIQSKPVTLGLVGDYEAWGGLPTGCGTKRANCGLLANVKF